MSKLMAFLEKNVCDTISAWNEEDIYAISFFLYSNEAFEYRGFSNITKFFISYNTEKDCESADETSEKRWNYAFWRQNEIPIIDTENEGIRILFDWYEQKGINNIGYEDYANCYDDEMKYIGKGPIGYYELLCQVAIVAKKIQDSGFIKNKFGKSVPIIIHDLEYSWYVMEATKIANPNGEADSFFNTMRTLGFVD